MPTINIKWATNTDELKANLRQGLDVINATRSQVDKLVQSFRGEALATSAHKWAAAISEIGGAAKLTAAEVERANTIFQKFIEKQQALGAVIPTNVQNLAKETAARVSATKALAEQVAAQTRLRSMVQTGLSAAGIGGLTGVGVVSAFAAAARDALAYADALSKLSDRTGITATGLQRLDAIARPSGNSLEQLASAINQFQRRLVEGGSETSAALAKIGLSIAELTRLNPDDQFIAIARGLQQIKDPAEQAAIAMALFGKGGAEILPSLKAKVDELADSTFKMSEQAVAYWDAFGDAVDRNKRSIINAIAEIIAKGQTNPAAFFAALGFRVTQQGLQGPAPTQQSLRGDIGLSGQGQFQVPGLPSDALIRSIENQSRELFAQAQFKLDEPIRKAAEALEESLRRLGMVLPGLRNQVGELNDTELKAIDIWLKKKEAADDLAKSVRKLLNEIEQVKPGQVDTDALGGLDVETIGRLRAKFNVDDTGPREAVKAFGELSRVLSELSFNTQGATSEVLNLSAGFADGIGAMLHAVETFKTFSISSMFSMIGIAIQLGVVVGRLLGFLRSNAFSRGIGGTGVNPGIGAGAGSGGRPPRQPAATGGLVTAFGIQRFAFGGMAQPMGTDTVPAMLTPGEIILNRAQQRNLAAAAPTVNVNVDARGAFGVDQFALRRWGRALAPMIAEAVAQNKGHGNAHAYTMFRGALGQTS